MESELNSHPADVRMLCQLRDTIESTKFYMQIETQRSTLPMQNICLDVIPMLMPKSLSSIANLR